MNNITLYCGPKAPPIPAPSKKQGRVKGKSNSRGKKHDSVASIGNEDIAISLPAPKTTAS